MAPALDKGLDILEYLSEVGVPKSQIEIANGLGKTPNEIYRMLVCLEERGYLLKNASGRYSISLKLYQLSHRHSPVEGLVKMVKPFMERLSNQTHQSCHLSIVHHGKLMIIAQTQSPGPVSLSIEEGSLFPLLKTTSGRVALAVIPDDERKALLQRDHYFSDFSEAEKTAFWERLKGIAERGYEMEQSEITLGVTDVAVPVGCWETGVFAVLAISSLSRIDKERESGEQLIEALLKAASEINVRLGVQ